MGETYMKVALDHIVHIRRAVFVQLHMVPGSLL